MTNGVDFGTSKVIPVEARTSFPLKRKDPRCFSMPVALSIVIAFLLLAGYA